MEFLKGIAATSIVGLSYNSESMSLLPQELIYEILLRLPVKTLLKMRCVSKSWLSLISSSQFVKTHLILSANNQEYTHHSLLYIKNWGTLHTCSFNTIMHEKFSFFPFERDDFPYRKESVHHYFILGSCNGLFCISSCFKIYFIWNPSTREFKEFPLSQMDITGSYGEIRGFGYDECQKDYKMVAIKRKKDTEYGFLNEFKFYSLRTNSWRKILEFPSATILSYLGKFINGRLHWIASHKTESRVDSSTFILSLDLVNETCGTIAFPNDKFDWRLETLGSNLCVFSDRVHDQRMDVWVMKEHGLGKSWNLVISVPLCNFGRRCPWPIFIFQNDEILLKDGSGLVLYNSTHDSFKRSKAQVELCFGRERYMYVEGLVSPNSLVKI